MAVYVSCPTPCPSWSSYRPFSRCLCEGLALEDTPGYLLLPGYAQADCGPWTQIPTALTCHGAGLSLAMGKLPFLNSLCNGTRPPSPRGTLWMRMHEQQGEHLCGGQRLCLSRDFVYG